MADLPLGPVITNNGLARVLGQLTVSGYIEDEQSLDRGEPEELYLFNRDDTDYWSFTSIDYDIIYNGRTYTATLIRRSDIILSANSLKNTIDIEMLISNPFILNLLNGLIEGEIKLTIYRRHKGANSFITYWNGYVRGCGCKGNKAIILAGLKDSSLNRNGIMRKYSRNCGIPLYSTLCTISKSDAAFQITGTVLSVDGTTITAAEFDNEDDNWLKGGIFKLDDDTLIQSIIYHVGTTIKISRATTALVEGKTFTAWAGCDHAKATCKNKFSNKLNYGGQPWLPTKNPFIGDPITSAGV